MRMELDKSNAVLMGVCSGFARWADVDLLLARITAVLVAIVFAPVAIPAYLMVALALRPEAECEETPRLAGLWSTPFAPSQIVW
jgi:phage shock protein PspC (stress-responsive transcriptional regulator)